MTTTPPAPVHLLPPELRVPRRESDRSRELLGAFAEVVDRAGESAPGPELLPSRLVAAAAQVLDVCGAGVSLLFDGGRRLPIGASGLTAALAERLQFTAGDGPCWRAQELRRTVVAGPVEVAQRWPVFAAGLTSRTPYRAVVAVPLAGRLDGVGTVDLYLSSVAQLRALDIADTVAVADAIARRLTAHLDASPAAHPTAHLDDPFPGDRSPRGPDVAHGPGWLGSPGVRQRARVWQALGRLDGELGVSEVRALALLRAHARRLGTTVDAVAADVVSGALSSAVLAAGPPTPAG